MEYDELNTNGQEAEAPRVNKGRVGREHKKKLREILDTREAAREFFAEGLVGAIDEWNSNPALRNFTKTLGAGFLSYIASKTAGNLPLIEAPVQQPEQQIERPVIVTEIPTENK